MFMLRDFLTDLMHFDGGGRIIINLIASEISWKFNGVQPEETFFMANIWVINLVMCGRRKVPLSFP